MIGYAFTLGLLAAVNPCGFPLLPAYLASFAASPAGAGPARRIALGLSTGACLTLGFVAVFAVAGALVSLGGSLALAWTPWVMVVVGVALALFGLATVAGRAPTLALPTPGLRAGRGITAMVAYGVTYAIGSLSCSLPLFLASVTERFVHLGGWAGVGTVLAYALGMGFFVTGTGVIASLAGTGAARRFRQLGRIAPVVGGLVLIVCGLYLAVYWITDILTPESTLGVVAIGSRIQESVSSWLSTYPLRIGLVAGLVVLAGFVVVVIAEARAATPHLSERTPRGND